MKRVVSPFYVSLRRVTYALKFFSSSRQSEQIFRSLYEITFRALPQNIQDGSYFLRTIVLPSTKISRLSFSLISSVLRSSIGRVILPNSSTCRTMPVDLSILNTSFVIKFLLKGNKQEVARHTRFGSLMPASRENNNKPNFEFEV